MCSIRRLKRGWKDLLLAARATYSWSQVPEDVMVRI